jgi:hypothetical protein
MPGLESSSLELSGTGFGRLRLLLVFAIGKGGMRWWGVGSRLLDELGSPMTDPAAAPQPSRVVIVKFQTFNPDSRPISGWPWVKPCPSLTLNQIGSGQNLTERCPNPTQNVSGLGSARPVGNLIDSCTPLKTVSKWQNECCHCGRASKPTTSKYAARCLPRLHTSFG